MSEQKHNLLSALIDGELAPEERERVIDAVLNDVELQQDWAAHYTTSALLHGEYVESVDDADNDSFAQRIASALDDEPAIMAPNAIGTDKLPMASEPELAVQPRRANGALYAIAASVMALAVVTAVPKFGALFDNNQATAPIAAASAPQSQVAEVAGMTLEQELQALMVSHGEFGGMAALNGLVAYAKFVNGDQLSGNSN